MVTLTFRDIKFSQIKDKVIISLYNIYSCEVDNSEFEKIGKYKIENNNLIFSNISESKALRKFNLLLQQGFANLKNKLGNKKTIYIHQNSGIPLIGTNYFGLIDRDTNVIEVKPFTGCNFNCIYCSVDEGIISKRTADYIVEEEYLFQEFQKLVEVKGIDNIDAHINAQGETTLYSQIIKLVKDISSLKQVKTISIDTNGSLLTKEFVDALSEAGLTRINLSLNAIDDTLASKIAGNPVNLKKIMDIARYIPKKTDLVIAPVWLPGINDDELPKLAKFALDIGAGKNCPPISIQNFLYYQYGRNPVEQQSFESFYKRLRDIEKVNDVKLLYEKGFGITSCKKLIKPFKRNEIIEAKVILPGRFKGEMIAAAKGRLISVFNCYKEGKIKIRIRRTKHNIFTGELS